MELHLLESAICGNIPESLSPRLSEMFHIYQGGDYERCLELAQKLYHEEEQLPVKAFMLHFICVLTEVKYDLPLRARWMNRWPQIILMHKDAFTVMAHKYHMANTCYFESHFLEAHQRYKELSIDPNCPLRFKALAHFHLGLIYQHRQLARAAMNEMKAAFDLAYEIQHQRLLARIREQITVLDDQIQFSFLDSDLCALLRQKKYVESRQMYLQKRREERHSGIRRGQSSLHALLPALVSLKESPRKSMRILAALDLISDAALKVQSMGFVRSLGHELPELRALEDHLATDLGITPLEFDAAEHEARFLGHSLRNMGSEDLARFTSYILSEKSVTKEGICRHVWSLDYDPVIHDGKIYKLIHRFRDYFGKKDLIINRYGSYEVNQRYRA